MGIRIVLYVPVAAFVQTSPLISSTINTEVLSQFKHKHVSSIMICIAFSRFSVDPIFIAENNSCLSYRDKLVVSFKVSRVSFMNSKISFCLGQLQFIFQY